MACKAQILEGKRKGQPCQFPPSDNGFCGRHHRHYEFEQLTKENKIPCRLFFRGCDAIVTKGGACDECKIKLSKKTVFCQHNKCKFKTKGAKYCKKHSRDIYRDEEKAKNIKYCDISRGCLTICKEGYKKCDMCRDKSYEREKEQRKNLIQLHNLIEQQTNSLKQICINCGKDYEQFKTRYNKPSKICQGCNNYNNSQDQQRQNRGRDFNNESFRNIERYYNDYIKNATKRNYSFSLNIDTFKSLVLSECYYCQHQKEDGVNGIDRINNSIGYELENCVSCCGLCNMMKWAFHPLFFVKLCKIISGFEVPSSSFYETWKEYYISRPASYYKSKNIAEKDRKFPFHITKEQWLNIVHQPCYLCGFQSKRGIGLDRVDSNKHEYTIDNVKPCCYTCNVLKKNYSLEQIQEQATLISCIWTDTSIFEFVPKA